jgi:hypothetical protein
MKIEWSWQASLIFIIYKIRFDRIKYRRSRSKERRIYSEGIPTVVDSLTSRYHITVIAAADGTQKSLVYDPIIYTFYATLKNLLCSFKATLTFLVLLIHKAIGIDCVFIAAPN